MCVTRPCRRSRVCMGFGFRVSGFRFRDSGFGFRVSAFGFRVSGFGFRVSVSGLGFRVWGVGFRVSGFGFQVSGFGFRVLCVGVACRRRATCPRGPLREGGGGARVALRGSARRRCGGAERLRGAVARSCVATRMVQFRCACGGLGGQKCAHAWARRGRRAHTQPGLNPQLSTLHPES